MGFLWLDGFDHYTTISQKYEDSSAVTISSDYGRFGTSGIGSNDYSYRITKTIAPAATLTTLYVGFAANTIEDFNRQAGLVQFLDSAGQPQCKFAVQPYQPCIEAYRSASSFLGRTTKGIPVGPINGGWNYLEFKAVIDGSNGEMRVRCNGEEIMSLTGQNTKGTGYTGCNNVRVGWNGASGWVTNTLAIDDLYIADDDWKGDLHVLTYFPDGAGNYTQWDASAGSNYQCVDENPVSTSDYVSTLAVDEIDTYSMTDTTKSTGTILVVAGNIFVQPYAAASRSVSLVTRLSGTDLVSTEKLIGSSAKVLQFIQETKPGGGSWSIQNTKDAEMGMKLEV